MGEVFEGLVGFAEEAEEQARYFDAHCPVYARLLRAATALFAEDARARDAVAEAWRGRPFHARYERPLLLCAALRLEALRDPSHPLARAIATEPPDDAAIDGAAIGAALARAGTLDALRTRRVQTNEVSRAIAWRLPLAIAARGREIALVDLGCSAALNLVADRLDVAWSDAAGQPIDVAPTGSAIVARVGLDRAPLDPRDADVRDWLRASFWPGQALRRARLDAGLAAAQAALDRGELTIEARDATEMPARLDAIARAHPGAFVLAYQTVVLDYLLPEVREPYLAGMRDWLLRHPRRALWAELERAPKCAPGPAELRVRFARPDASLRTLVLGSGEYHPRSITLSEAAIAELRDAFASCALP